jgi:F0F1-type ATP synthase membrane subunit b/b'
MDLILKSLADLLLRALPTIFFLTLLTIYLKFVFFKPLERILHKRHEQTEGVRRLAEKALKEADHKAGQFERALIAAKMELYREQEAHRRRWLAEQAKTLAEARRVAEARIEETRLELSVESEQAIAEMAPQIRELSKEMIANLFGRRAA